MFGTLGGPELFLIFVVALIVFGPRKLPEIGKSLGRMMGEFRRASNDFRSTIESEVEAEKIRESMRIEPPKVDPVKSGASSAAGAGASPAPPPGKSDAASPPDPPSSAAGGAVPPESDGESPEAPGTDPADPATEPVPETVSRQPTSPTVERK